MGPVLAQLMPLILMTGFLYLIIFIPSIKRDKEHREMIHNLKVDDEIITKGGIMGSIKALDDDYITLLTGPDNIKLKVSKTGILGKVHKEVD